MSYHATTLFMYVSHYKETDAPCNMLYNYYFIAGIIQK